MVGLATGLAKEGFIPYVYSIAPFAVLRPFEFIKNGPIAHQFPVRIVGIGGGYDYGIDGFSHYALEDIALMRTEKGIDVVAPADPDQARSALISTYDLPRPIYYRITKSESPKVDGLNGKFESGRAQLLKPGKDVLFVVLGNLAGEALAAAKDLSEKNIDCGVLLVSSVVPAPTEDLISALKGCKLAVSVETQYVNGGIGSFVAETIAENGLPCRLVRNGIKKLLASPAGSFSYWNELSGLTKKGLIETVVQSLRATKT